MKAEIPELRISDYDYPLPDERIARYPLPRGQAKLLIAGKNQFAQDIYQNIVHHLPQPSWLIFNETKVIPARLYFTNSNGALIEVFCLEAFGGGSLEQLMETREKADLRCLVGGARKWKNEPLQQQTPHGPVQAEKLGRTDEGDFHIRLSWPGNFSFAEILEAAGKVPLPPYLKREAEASDRENYQTIYARLNGSVAAPTAGLHFNQAIFNDLAEYDIERDFLTLHVGAGTFKPVSSEEIKGHKMHREEVSISREFLQRLIDKRTENLPIIPVGTTSLRALESLFWLAQSYAEAKELPPELPVVDQWAGFQAPKVGAAEAFRHLAGLMDNQKRTELHFDTRLIIAPGYQHRLISALVTNFHQPKSTLLLLIASLLGSRWREMYQYALDHQFRFLSYGDGCLIYR